MSSPGTRLNQQAEGRARARYVLFEHAFFQRGRHFEALQLLEPFNLVLEPFSQKPVEAAQLERAAKGQHLLEPHSSGHALVVSE